MRTAWLFLTIPAALLFGLFGPAQGRHAALSAAQKPRPQTWGETVDGLQMTIYPDQAEGVRPKTPKFRVELRNVGENDVVLNLGSMLANGGGVSLRILP